MSAPWLISVVLLMSHCIVGSPFITNRVIAESWLPRQRLHLPSSLQLGVSTWLNCFQWIVNISDVSNIQTLLTHLFPFLGAATTVTKVTLGEHILKMEKPLSGWVPEWLSGADHCWPSTFYPGLLKNKARNFFKPVVLKMWSPDQQLLHPLGTF